MHISKKALKAIIIAVVVVILLVVAYMLASRLELSHSTLNEDAENSDATVSESYASVATEEVGEEATDEEDEVETEDSIYYNGAYYVLNENLSTLLILGIDDFEVTESDTYRNSSQADLVLVAVFDEENKTCTLLHLNRDTMTNVSVLDALGHDVGVTYEQLALAHTYGRGLEDSCENTVNTVSSLLYGVEIDNYISLTMDAVSILNDAVGGVTVTIEDDFTGVDDTLVQGETVTLMGEHALNFVRARYSMTDDSSNLARMERQKTYMVALTSALKSAASEDAAFLLETYTAIADYVVTDCDINAMADYGTRLSEYSLTDIVSPDGEAIKGEVYMEYYVDETALQQLVVDLFYVPIEEG